ncbi:MAG: glycine cleavage system protein H [Desulfobacterales bacterium]|nr:glycine cleavage system protein H [Desulfobacterales bacterium]
MGTTRLENRQVEKEGLCIWSQAGVIHRKICDIAYDCPACNLDRALRRAADENRRMRERGAAPKGKRGEIVFWKDKLRDLPRWKQPCIHSMKGRIDFRACTNDYSCADCEFDQYFQDQYAVHAVVTPVSVLDIQGFTAPQGYYLHPGHAWAKMEEGGAVRVGLDDFALRLLGPLNRIEAPLVGKECKQNRADIRIRRGGEEAKILSPVSGVVTDINPALREEGALANKAPYSDGWVLRVYADNIRKDLKNLMMGGETESFLGQEVDRLYEVIEETEPLAADGGALANDIYGNMPSLGWERLTNLFLRSR